MQLVPLQLGVPVHCVVLGGTPEPPPGWPLVVFPPGDESKAQKRHGKSFAATAPAIAAATSGRLQWVDAEGLVAALQPLSTKSLETSAEKYEREAAETMRLHDEYVATVKEAIRIRWRKGKGPKSLWPKELVNQFKWIPTDGLTAAAEAIEEAIDADAGDDDDGDKQKKKKKKKKMKKKTGKKGRGSGNEWMKEWGASGAAKTWKGYGSQIYYQPRSNWPPLPRQARKLAKERNENTANDPDRFRPWDGDTAPWEPPMGALTAPMRDLTLINQPPWRHNSPSGGGPVQVESS
jgi:hypothetical protein